MAQMTTAGWSEPLSDFFLQLDEYEPTISLEVIKYYMKRAGVNADSDPRVAKLLALATDKFLVETLFEAKQFSELRGVSKGTKRQLENKDVHLEIEDLERSYELQGIFQRRKLAEKEETGNKSKT